MNAGQIVKIGGATGYWGDSDTGLPQLLEAGSLDYIVFDYLAEITMSIMARARAKDAQLGYAVDFVSGLERHLNRVASEGVKIISNAGGVNPRACGEAIRKRINEAGLNLKVAVVTGDDLTSRAAEFENCREMFSSAPFPASDSIASINAYIGAFPIAAALDKGADIVITGRCVDSAVTLGACIHEFGWGRKDWDKLAGASLAGHILECGAQATGGNFTDWEEVDAGLADVGHPIAEIRADGSFDVTKPVGSGGIVTLATVGEQMLYEIGDPQAYILPDVVCDFSDVVLTQSGDNRVSVTGAKGRPAPDAYKVSATFSDGWKIATIWFFIGEEAARKAKSFSKTALTRTQRKLRAMTVGEFDEVLSETLGDESHYGSYKRVGDTREVLLKLAAKHADPKACAILLKEATGLALAAPPGLALFSGGRPKPSPVVRLFSFLLPKTQVPITVTIEGKAIDYGTDEGTPFDPSGLERPDAPVTDVLEGDDLVETPLITLAWARSGDKGDKANIGVLPRRPEYVPWIWAALTEDEVARRFAHFTTAPVERFFLPGTGAINFLLHDVLGGGGVASLRNDPQGKSFAQILLQTPIPIPHTLMTAH